MTAEHWQYLSEARARLLRFLQGLSLCFGVCFWFSNKLYTYLASPLLKHLPQGAHLVATDITSTFTVPTKLALLLALLITMPYLLYQIWAFISPALYPQEHHYFLGLIGASTLLFYAGLGFGFYVLCPMALGFFTKAAPEGVALMADIGRYLSFILHVILASGLAFQVPIVTFLSIQAGWLSINEAKKQRPFVIISAFTLGMLLTPPDVISQILLALPMWALFEISLWWAQTRQKTQISAKGPGSQLRHN